MAIELGSLKDHALANQAMRAGVPAGDFQVKLLTVEMESSKAGAPMGVSTWLILNPYALETPQDPGTVAKLRGKTIKFRFVLEGKGSEFGKPNFGAHMTEICKDTGHDLDQYRTDTDYKQLFLEIAMFTVIREIHGKTNPKNPQYPNWSLKADRNGGVPALAAAPVAPAPVQGTQWAQPAAAPVAAPAAVAPVAAPVEVAPVAPAAVAPAPVVAPAAPTSTVNKLFGGL
jgi:hypothetical protein